MESLHRKYLQSAIALLEARHATEQIVVLNNLSHPAWSAWHHSLSAFRKVEKEFIDSCLQRCGPYPEPEQLEAIAAMKIDPASETFGGELSRSNEFFNKQSWSVAV